MHMRYETITCKASLFINVHRVYIFRQHANIAAVYPLKRPWAYSLWVNAPCQFSGKRICLLFFNMYSVSAYFDLMPMQEAIACCKPPRKHRPSCPGALASGVIVFMSGNAIGNEHELKHARVLRTVCLSCIQSRSDCHPYQGVEQAWK
jgi:hypothetical protein